MLSPFEILERLENEVMEQGDRTTAYVLFSAKMYLQNEHPLSKKSTVESWYEFRQQQIEALTNGPISRLFR